MNPTEMNPTEMLIQRMKAIPECVERFNEQQNYVKEWNGEAAKTFVRRLPVLSSNYFTFDDFNTVDFDKLAEFWNNEREDLYKIRIKQSNGLYFSYYETSKDALDAFERYCSRENDCYEIQIIKGNRILKHQASCKVYNQ